MVTLVIETAAQGGWLGTTSQELVRSLLDPVGWIGLCGQTCFFLRFLVQWLVSEKKKRSVVPRSFWWLSIAGATLMLVYGVLIAKGPIVLGQIPGFVAYIRNMVLISRSGPTLPLGSV